MKHTLLGILLSFFAVNNLMANDGVYFANGNLLLPVKETTISVQKEILTITIGKDSLASVDVYYEFYNPDSTKTITMAFESETPYNVSVPKHMIGTNPFIRNFTVTMNGKILNYKNMPVLMHMSAGQATMDYDVPIDLSKWKDEKPQTNSDMEELYPGELYNAELDSTIETANAACFEATFLHGKNTVHHTYQFMMSYNIMAKFEIPYWLTPATRWANHRIDDFTLRIKNDNYMGFCFADTLFSAAPFKVVDGFGQVYHANVEYLGECTFADVNDGTLEWHAENFAPTSNLTIYSADYIVASLRQYPVYEGKVVVDKEGTEYRYIGENGDSYLVDGQDYGYEPKAGRKVVTYEAVKGQGSLFIKYGWCSDKYTDLKSGHSVNVREKPSKKSRVLTTIRDTPGDLPEVYPCLGMTNDAETGESWFKTKVGNKIGYINASLMVWDSINTF